MTPSRTASQVCGGATGCLGSRLHLTRPEVTFSMSWHSGTSMAAVSACVGGNHELAFRVTWAATGAETASAASPMKRANFIFSSFGLVIGEQLPESFDAVLDAREP